MTTIPDNVIQIRVAWWNVNKKFYLQEKTNQKLFSCVFDSKYDLVFLSETNLDYNSLPEIEGYVLISDPSVVKCNHGGLAWYIKASLAKHVFDINYKQCYISLRVDLFPKLVFIGAYIQPEGGRYFDPTMFSDVANITETARRKGLIPYVGGDFNSRLGDLNEFRTDCSWKYEPNIDSVVNKHGKTLFKDMCTAADINPINGVKYKKRRFDNEYTFIRANGKSQIDFVLTDGAGRMKVRKLEMVQDGWHISDHRPVTLEITVDQEVDAQTLLIRAQDINYCHDDINVTQFRQRYDYGAMSDSFLELHDLIESDVQSCLQAGDINSACDTLDYHLASLHKQNKLPKHRKETSSQHQLENVNTLFETYLSEVSDGDPNATNTLNTYLQERKGISVEAIRNEALFWNGVIDENDAKRFWSTVDWKNNNRKRKNRESPSMEEFESFFEDLYKCEDSNDMIEIEKLESDINIPILDDPISKPEMETAFKDIKKAGYDYNLPVIGILMSNFSVTLLTMLNFMFYKSYPFSLAVSLLSLIPKSGNLKLCGNYRGIQMMKSLACLFDRVIANRLKLWLTFHI